MVDYKTQVINQILVSCIGLTDAGGQKELKNILETTLYNYDITPKEEYKDLPATVDSFNEELLKRFLLAKTIESLSKNSIKLYKYRMSRFLQDINKKIVDITTDDIRFYLATCKTSNNSNTTLSNIKSCLSSFFIWLLNEGYINNNPISKIATIKKDTMKEAPFTSVDIEKMNNACGSIRDRAILEFLLSTGCRVSELVSVNIDDINFNTKQLDIIGKGNKQRTVYLTDVAILYIKQYIESRHDNNPSLFVALRKPYKTITKDAVQTLLKSIGDKSGVIDVHPHRFRRTMCCNLINHGMQIQDVSKIMGHSSIQTTEIYYNSISMNIKHEFNTIAN